MAVAALLALAAAGGGWRVLAAGGGDEQVVTVLAMRFDFEPEEIVVKKERPVRLVISTLDRLHGFEVPALGLRADIEPGASTEVRFLPQQAGIFEFHCTVFCGSGHEGMSGRIKVEE
jgi:cytochrome c oxidase subunit 2